MTERELIRKLKRLGCTFEHGTKHLVVYYRGARTLVPRHPSKEVKTGTYHAILKDLKINER
ncbi:MAG: type II toxin-antitoxin system HicA family toxin [Acidobacteria bacterium]|nr:type II toxin-antitoxin system HicA family toxin [Acidobacteriota bacterium]